MTYSYESYSQFEKGKTPNSKEAELLENVCNAYSIRLDAVKNLVEIEMSMIGKRRRRGLHNQIDNVIQSSILSKEKEVNNVNKESNF